ncbi:AbrB/MazE/SpoVT family DNA-binding domain-containing protein [Dactylosporangium sp. NPDC050688]|uniref:AbrB/MazE/SpoVT family DNA-binding domain-containing protein n=1 Tax=Dactylosporangium sp. NPDC050688 TaxID=3157217 RepID=UPI0033ED092C
MASINDQGIFQLGSTGHLVIPAAVRRWCELRPGNRILLAGDPVRNVIVVHPSAAIDAMVEQLHSIRLGDSS